MNQPATIFVRLTVPAWHRWPDAPVGRAYLRQPHRHLWHYEARMPVHHDERDVEFHDLMREVRIWLAETYQQDEGDGFHFGARSCETLARELGEHLAQRHGREVEVSVSEDGEAGACVRVAPPPPAPPGAV